MANPGAQILRMSDAEIIANGLGCAFTVETTQGPLRLCIPAADIGNVVAFMAGIARVYEEALGAPAGSGGQPSNFTPISATGLGVAKSDTPDASLLVVGLSGFELAFEIPHSELERTGRAMLAMSAGGAPS